MKQLALNKWTQSLVWQEVFWAQIDFEEVKDKVKQTITHDQNYLFDVKANKISKFIYNSELNIQEIIWLYNVLEQSFDLEKTKEFIGLMNEIRLESILLKYSSFAWITYRIVSIFRLTKNLNAVVWWYYLDKSLLLMSEMLNHLNYIHTMNLKCFDYVDEDKELLSVFWEEIKEVEQWLDRILNRILKDNL